MAYYIVLFLQHRPLIFLYALVHLRSLSLEYKLSIPQIATSAYLASQERLNLSAL